MAAYWLFKSEPDVFSYDHLVRNKREGWDGVRNYQARNFMRAMKVGERGFFWILAGVTLLLTLAAVLSLRRMLA